MPYVLMVMSIVMHEIFFLFLVALAYDAGYINMFFSAVMMIVNVILVTLIWKMGFHTAKLFEDNT